MKKEPCASCSDFSWGKDDYDPHCIKTGERVHPGKHKDCHRSEVTCGECVWWQPLLCGGKACTCEKLNYKTRPMAIYAGQISRVEKAKRSCNYYEPRASVKNVDKK